MSGTQSLIVIVSLAFVFGGVLAWRAWLGYRLECAEIDARARLIEQDIRRLEVVRDLVTEARRA